MRGWVPSVRDLPRTSRPGRPSAGSSPLPRASDGASSATRFDRVASPVLVQQDDLWSCPPRGRLAESSGLRGRTPDPVGMPIHPDPGRGPAFPVARRRAGPYRGPCARGRGGNPPRRGRRTYRSRWPRRGAGTDGSPSVEALFAPPRARQEHEARARLEETYVRRGYPRSAASSRSRTRANAACRRLVMGPGAPDPIGSPSARTTGMISRSVLVMKASSAP